MQHSLATDTAFDKMHEKIAIFFSIVYENMLMHSLEASQRDPFNECRQHIFYCRKNKTRYWLIMAVNFKVKVSLSSDFIGQDETEFLSIKLRIFFYLSFLTCV